jgi:hypothetical protein
MRYATGAKKASTAVKLAPARNGPPKRRRPEADITASSVGPTVQRMEKTSSAELHELRRQWRDATREWLAARNALARLQDATIVDMKAAMRAARRLEQAERRRVAVNRQVEAVLEKAHRTGESIG